MTVWDWVERAKSTTNLVRQHADAADENRHMSASVAKKFAELGLYRLAAPTQCGGVDLDPETQMRVIEIISRIAGSSGWNLMIGIETLGLVVPSMATCLDMISDPNIIMSSSTADVGRAVKCPSGWRISGQWQFVSGIHNAHVFGATVQRFEDDSAIDDARFYAVLPREDYRILDTWHVSGLRGSGSHDVVVADVFVPQERLVATLGQGSMASNQLNIPFGVRLTFNKVAVALGIARAGIDAFQKLAQGKQPRFSYKNLKSRPFAQRAVAQAEILLRGVRAAIYEHVRHIWRQVFAVDKLSDDDRAIAHLLASDAAKAAVECVEFLQEAAGTSANLLSNPLERIGRDVKVVRQHATVAPHHIDDAAAVLLGNPPHGILQM